MKRFRATTGLYLILIFLILASCNGQNTATPQLQESITSSPYQTKRPTSISPTMQPYNATMIATSHAKQATFTAGAQNANDDCEGHPDDVWSIGIVERVYSPSKTWYVAYCEYPDSGLNYTKIIKTINDIVWEIPYKKFPGGSVEVDGQMLLEAWSYNERYAFFQRFFCCVDSPFLEFINGYGLYRLDLNTGEILEIEKSWTAFSFSPNGKYLARSNFDTKNIIIDNLETEKYSSYAIEFEVAGKFRWSPDGSKVAFSATHEDWLQHYSDTGFAVYLIDMNSLTLKLLIYRPPNYFTADRWISDSEVLLVDNSMKSKGEYFILNVKTHELTPSDSNGLFLTPTP